MPQYKSMNPSQPLFCPNCNWEGVVSHAVCKTRSIVLCPRCYEAVEVKMTRVKEEEPHGNEAWMSTKEVYPDSRLRRLGFSIHSRPKTGSTLWRSKEGKIVTEAEAVLELTS